MTDDLKWLDDSLDNYGTVKLTEIEAQVEPDLPKQTSLPAISSPKLSVKETFQVDTSEVLSRLKKAIWPFYSESFFSDLPYDLYSPFWITTTLILLISATNAIESKSLSVLISSSSLFYSLLFIVPGSLYCLLFHNGSSFEFYMLVSLYGYSLTQFILPAIFGVFLQQWLRWPVWAVSAGLSLKFLHKNIYEEVEKVLGNKKFYAIGIVFLGHLCLVLSGNMFF